MVRDHAGPAAEVFGHDARGGCSDQPSSGAAWHWWFLGLWATVWFLADLHGGGYSWHYFANGSTLLFSGSGLRLIKQTALARQPDLRSRPQALRMTVAAAGAVFLIVWASTCWRCSSRHWRSGRSSLTSRHWRDRAWA
ncbi:hypothetical protein ACWCQW_49995 [Streptomyces mirabilis]